MRNTVVCAFAAWVGVLAGCATPGEEAASDALRQRAVALFGIVQPVASTEVSAPQALLGRALFWDPRLSVDGKTACASCPAREDWSSDRPPLSINGKGQPTAQRVKDRALTTARWPRWALPRT